MIKYCVSFRKVEGNKSNFVKVGVAFQEEDGTEGGRRIQIKLDSLPIPPWDGRLTLFPIDQKEK